MKKIVVEDLEDYPVGTKFIETENPDDPKFIYLCLLDDIDHYTGIYALNDKSGELEIFELYDDVYISDIAKPLINTTNEQFRKSVPKVFKYECKYDNGKMYVMAQDEQEAVKIVNEHTALPCKLSEVKSVLDLKLPWIIHNTVLPF